MYKNILIATDGSDLARKAVGQGLALARDLGAKAVVVTVSESWTQMVTGEAVLSFPIEEYERMAAANASRIFSEAAEVARKLGIQCETLHVKDKLPADGIVETAKALGSDLIVMASHGRRGLQRMLLGSQANKVVTLSPVPVLICR